MHPRNMSVHLFPTHVMPNLDSQIIKEDNACHALSNNWHFLCFQENTSFHNTRTQDHFSCILKTEVNYNEQGFHKSHWYFTFIYSTEYVQLIQDHSAFYIHNAQHLQPIKKGQQ